MKQLTIFLSIVVLGAAMIGCSRSDANQGPMTEVRLGFFPNVTHAQAVLGVTSGDFARAVGPIKFTPRQFNAGPDLIQALFAGQIDIGYVGPGPVINAFATSHGQGIRVIDGAAANGVLIVARKASGITTIADLKGRRIATPQQHNTQDIAARHYLTAVLGQTDTNNVLPFPNADQFSMMQQGQIDAAWVPEPWGSMLIARTGATLVAQEKDLWPGGQFALTVVVTTPEFLAAHGDVVQKLLAVHRDWTARLTANPADCIPKLEAGLNALTGNALPPGTVSEAVSHVKFTEDPSPQTFDTNARWAFDLGFSRQKTDLTGLIVQSTGK